MTGGGTAPSSSATAERSAERRLELEDGDPTLADVQQLLANLLDRITHGCWQAYAGLETSLSEWTQMICYAREAAEFLAMATGMPIAELPPVASAPAPPRPPAAAPSPPSPQPAQHPGSVVVNRDQVATWVRELDAARVRTLDAWCALEEVAAEGNAATAFWRKAPPASTFEAVDAPRARGAEELRLLAENLKFTTSSMRKVLAPAGGSSG